MTMNAYPSPLYAILCSRRMGVRIFRPPRGESKTIAIEMMIRLCTLKLYKFNDNDNQQQQVEDNEMKTSFAMKARIERQQERIILRI